MHQPATTAGGRARFLSACHSQATDATPVWFMGQAGSTIAEYRRMRERYDILTIARTPELCAQVSLLPIAAYHVDAAVMHTDIVLPLQAMGLDTAIQPAIGPIIHNPVRTMRDVQALRVPEAREGTPFVLRAITLVREALSQKQALIGIAGGPFTLALYIIEGRPSRDYATAMRMLHEQPAVWHALMHKLSTVLVDYVSMQVQAGADAIQLFDSSVGLLSPASYRRFVLPYSQRVLQAIEQAGVPSIHFGTMTASLLELMTQAGGTVQGLDWRYDLDRAWQQITHASPSPRAVQGNLDPTLLLAPWPRIEEGVNDILQRAAGRPGHIFNLGHAVPPQTDPATLQRLVEMVHEKTRYTNYL
jgi:uroporphyrinogen decarboxylase